MRIAYVNLNWPRTRNSGVGKKILRHISEWQSQGHDVRFFMHTSEYEPRTDLINGDIFPFQARKTRIMIEWERIRAATQLVRAVESFLPDLIYLRYSMYVYPVHRLASIAPLVEEMTTNDITQHDGLGFSFYLYNRLTRGIILRRVSGLVCLSKELAESSSLRIYAKPTRVIGDSIDLDEIQPLDAPYNDHPHVVFIGTPGAPWQGVDKLPVLAGMLPDLTFHVIGYDSLDGITDLPDNLILHGYLNTDQYIKVLAGMDLAISSLALHRIGLDQSSPLKTRECLAYGLPLILPYADTDLDDLDCDFILKIPNSEDNIRTNASLIRDFAYQMRGHRTDRSLFAARIDSKQKELERLSFFSEILDRSA
jgi:glycosyltransferase involved in cell wall biosynthesis